MVRMTEIHVLHPLLPKLKTGRAMRKLVCIFHKFCVLSNGKILFRLPFFILLESYGASEDYYLLSDVLPEDKELRNRLKLQRLVRNHSLVFTGCILL